ncbi:MAG: hypothetical protein HC844_04080, partial [Tabrizicola sp.]|nr:hypothetical protein [Tabrizicola sp.]
MAGVFDQLLAEIAGTSSVRPVGRVVETARGTISVTGLNRAALGDQVMILGQSGAVGGEVLRLSQSSLTILPDGPLDGLSIGDAVELVGKAEIAPDDSWIGRIIDPLGRPLDGRPILRGLKPRPLPRPPSRSMPETRSTRVVETPWVEPGPGQVAIRNRFAGCNAVFDQNLCRNTIATSKSCRLTTWGSKRAG